MAEVGLSEKADVQTKFLSGGEKQRVAIARALINKPVMILADEPTGNLDASRSKEIQQLLLKSVKKRQTTLIVVTHDVKFARQCSRVLQLKDGRLYDEDEN